MYGICGVISFQPERPADSFVLQQTNRSRRHHRPADRGFYQESRAALAMRKLSIIVGFVMNSSPYMQHWLCTSLKPTMLDLLLKASLQNPGYRAHEVLAEWIREHRDRRVNYSHRLWALLVFEMWHHDERVPA